MRRCEYWDQKSQVGRRSTHVGDHNEPMGDQEPGEHVVLDDLTSSPDGGSVGGSPDHGEDTEVGGDDGVALRGVEEDRVGIEVVGPLGVRLLARDVEEQVGGEGKDLLADEHEQGEQRSITEVVLLRAGLLAKWFG